MEKNFFILIFLFIKYLLNLLITITFYYSKVLLLLVLLLLLWDMVYKNIYLNSIINNLTKIT